MKNAFCQINAGQGILITSKVMVCAYTILPSGRFKFLNSKGGGIYSSLKRLKNVNRTRLPLEKPV